MYTLGMQLGYTPTITLRKDGAFIFAVGQEKFDNVKSSPAFPAEAITASSEQVVFNLENSGLENLAMENYIISKNRP